MIGNQLIFSFFLFRFLITLGSFYRHIVSWFESIRLSKNINNANFFLWHVTIDNFNWSLIERLVEYIVRSRNINVSWSVQWNIVLHENWRISTFDWTEIWPTILPRSPWLSQQLLDFIFVLLCFINHLNCSLLNVQVIIFAFLDFFFFFCDPFLNVISFWLVSFGRTLVCLKHLTYQMLLWLFLQFESLFSHVQHFVKFCLMKFLYWLQFLSWRLLATDLNLDSSIKTVIAWRIWWMKVISNNRVTFLA